MNKILSFITVCTALIGLQSSIFGQVRYQQPTGNAGALTQYDVDYRTSALYTDREGPNTFYLDNGDSTYVRFNAVGVGTRVRIDFDTIGFESNDTLFVFRDNNIANPPSDTITSADNGNAAAAAYTFFPSGGQTDITFLWVESGGGSLQGWRAFVDLVNNDGSLITRNYPWVGLVEGENADFIFNPGASNSAFVFCGFDAAVRWVMDDVLTKGSQTFDFQDGQSYRQRLDSIYVNWGDGSPIQGFDVNDTTNRNSYDLTGQSVFPTTTHNYAAANRYTVTVYGIDEIGVRSTNQTVSIIIEGDAPTSVTADDEEVCIGDPATLESIVEWRVDDYNSRILSQRWEGPDPANPGNVIELKNGSPGDNFYNVGPSVYPAPDDGDAVGYNDYTFCHYVTFDNGCGEVETCINYRVHKLPYAGVPDPAGDNTVCQDQANFDLNTLIKDNDTYGTWFDGSNNPVPNGIVTTVPAPGTYSYKYVVSSPECPSDEISVTLNVVRSPYAGTNDGTSVSNPLKLCVDQQNVDLYTLLDGNASRPTPDINGQWFLVEGATRTALNSPQINSSRFLDASQFNVAAPTASKLFRLCYQVTDQTGECAPVEECVFVRIYPEPYVKPTTVDTQVCENDPIIQMDNLVDESFRTAGNWQNYEWPAAKGGPVANQAFFEPNTETVPGTYKFRKYYRNPDNNNADICRIDSIVVTVEFFLKPEAGPDANYTICPSQPIDLYDTLLSAADVNGTFYGPLETVGDVPTVSPSAFAFDTDGGVFTFRYEVLGEGPCPDDEATLTFNVSPFKDAGMANSIIACTADPSLRIIDELNGTPDNGGVWSPTANLSGTSENAMFNPATAGAGSYTYSYAFPKSGACPAVSAQLDILVYNEPLAGNDFSETICNVDDNKQQYFYDLSAQISGNANGANFGVNPLADVDEAFGALEPVANAVTNPTTGMVNVKNLGGGTYNFFYRTFNPGCVADTAFFTITVNQVGNAGRDSLFVRCGSENALNLKNFIPGADNFGTWEDTDGTGAITSPPNFNAKFVPGDVEELSPDTGFRLIYIVEVDQCPDDSANVIAYVSEAPRSGIAKQGTDSLLYACEDETGLDLTDGLVDDSFTEPDGNPGSPLVGQWKIIKPSSGYLVPQAVFDDVNKNNRDKYFTGADSSQFDVEAFVEYWEGTETIPGSRQYTGGVSNTSFWQWLKEDRTLYFEYTVRDTSAGKLVIPNYYEGTSTSVPREINCAPSSTVILAAIMPDYDKRFTLEVDPAINGQITICNSITDLDLKQYFTELNSTASKLDIPDIFNPNFDDIQFEGIDPLIAESAIYPKAPNNRHFLDVSQLSPSFPNFPSNNPPPYNIRLMLESGKDANNKCGVARTQTGLLLDVEKIPEPGGFPGPGNEPISQFSLCEGSPSFDMHTKLEGDVDTWDPSRHFFTQISTAPSRVLGKNFNMNGADPGLYIVRYTIPTVACVNPLVSTVNDPGNTSNPKRFTSLLEITVTSGPDLDGYDAKVNTFDVCSEPAINLGRLFPLGNSIDQSGEFKILTGCGTINNGKDWNNATYTRGTGTCGSVLIEYTVTKDDCPPAKLQMRLNITTRPFPGVAGTDTVCLDNGLVDMFEILSRNYQGSKTIDRNGTFKGRGDKAQDGVKLGGFFSPTASGVGKFQVVYTVGDGVICQLDSAVVTIVVKKIERTGSDGSINACLGAPKLDLFDGLNGFYDFGGKWIPASPDDQQFLEGPQGSIFNHSRYRTLSADPQSSLKFRYVIDATCATDTSVVTVYLTPGPVSGRADTTVFVCNKLFEYDLFDALGVENTNDYLNGGIWRAVNSAPAPSYNGSNQALISPKDMANGTYLYRYTVEAECGDTVLTSTTEVTVKIGQNLSAGTNKTVAVCYADVINLNTFFGVNGSGVWVDTNMIGGLVDGNFFDLDQTIDQGGSDTYEYAYRVPEVYKNCGTNVAFYTLEIRRKPNAGRDTTVFYCNVDGSDFPALNLFPDRSDDLTLVAGPNVGNALSGGRFYPGRLSPGSYKISLIISDPKCTSDTAIANIYIQDKNDPNSVLCGALDGDGIRNREDLDVDGDGISNRVESRVAGISNDPNPFGNHDGDDLFNFQDPEYAALIGSFIRKNVVAAWDFDNDGLINALDLDSDGDLIPDIVEAFGAGNLTTYDANKDGRTDQVNTQGINAGTLGLTNSGSAPIKTTTGKADYLNIDSDNDGIGDIMEGRDHNNYADVTSLVFDVMDTDLDGTPDYQDTDSDDDTVLDSQENFGGSLLVVINTNATAAPGRVTVDNVPNFRDSDSDGDGIQDRREAFIVGGILNDFDNDGIPNIFDLDSDNDGISDFIEKGPTEFPRNTDATQISSYSVADAQPDFVDYDSDGDGILDIVEAGGVPFGDEPVNSDANAIGDLKADAIPDYRDLDSDGDRIPDMLELDATGALVDTDSDGLFDYRDADSDGDKYLDIYEALGSVTFPDTIFTGFVDFDLDGIPDYLDFDSDNDGICDRYEVLDHSGNINKVPFDADADGVFDFHDEDSDDDGLLDTQERGEGGEGCDSAPRDSDEDGEYDFRSIDADGDGILDRLEGDGDCDGDGIPNYRDSGDNCQITTFIPEAFSPNDDRVNDFFVIPDAVFFPGNKLHVFNRWGGLVFEMENYDNTWDGTKDGTKIPDGTYFYTFDLGIGQKPLTGFVYVSGN